ncbi:diguanylate cyclase [Cellvibrio zantedeschiae]|uniref:Diguanylate cyclase n=1 Tax=Cellvibrio zantedeschiae TaxID=1237077 RepID=A0ABQ3ATU9_9GAMM|nr:VOC family protein [Cellvibrio zantedeschiae]GGY65156.1 diguanylate cyclase [Cellvibrio zantedeschiae]
MHIEHINISAPMSLLTQVRDFYIEILGLTEGFRPESTIRGFWLYSGERALIHLAESNEHFANERQGHLDHIAFQTTGLKQVVDKLNKHEIPFSHDYFPEINMTQIFFKDPVGTGIEINFVNESL